MSFKEREYKDVQGAGGGKGSSSTSDAPDTIVTNETVKLLNLISEGEVNLFTGDGQSIFFNNVPLENEDGSYNFGGYDELTQTEQTYSGQGATYYEWRSGTASQSPMTNPAFPSASDIYSINEEIYGGNTTIGTTAEPVIYATQNQNTNYCLVEISFPDGLQAVNGQGDIVGLSVEIAIDVAPAGDGPSWVTVIDQVISGKASQAAAVQYQVNSPSPSGDYWQIRVRRLTQDSETSLTEDESFVGDITEVQQITLPYNGIAYCGLALDAMTIGGGGAGIPTLSFLVSKGPIAIPSNYTPSSTAASGVATYTGTWDGTFTTGMTDNPAWVLYDMLTNPQYGCYLYGIRASMIDANSFYSASVFNDAQVPDGNGGQERRFSFNAPIQSRKDVYSALQDVANMMNAQLVVINGLITLLQDQPTSSKYLVTKANCISDESSSGSGGGSKTPVYFKYSTNLLSDRTTSVNVTYTNASNLQYLPNTVSVQDSTYLAQYGYSVQDLAAFGATTPGQAMRDGRWYLYESLYNNRQVEFTTGLEGFLMQVWDVFDLFDDDYAGTAVSGRIVSATSNTVTLDQAVTLTGSVSTISLLLQDGVTYETYTLTNTAGTYLTVTINGTFSTIPTQYCPYGITSGVNPQQYRIIDIKIDGQTREATVTGKLYSSDNYTYVEDGYAVPSPVYSLPVQTAPTAPTDVTTTVTQYINPQNSQLQYGVIVEWQRPAFQNVGYLVKWQKDNGQWNVEPQQTSTQFELTNILEGTYDFLVYSVNLAGNVSAPASASYTLDTSGGGSSETLSEITDLYVYGTTGDTWTGLDCEFQFTNPVANQGLLKEFLVTISTTGGTQMRQVVVDPVEGGDSQNFTYTFAMNQSDSASLSLSDPQRSLVVLVQGMDSQNDLTTGITATFTNPSPAVPSNITSNPGPTSCNILWTPETQTDLSGYMLWSSTTSGFTPSSSNGIDLGDVALAALLNLTAGDTYYYVVAAYDVFGKSLSGTGMNLSSQLSFTVPTDVGIPAGPTFPSSGTDGEFFYNTANDTLYQYNGSAWVQIGMTYGSSLPASGNTNDLFYDTSNNTVYVWTGSAWGPAYNGASIQAASIGTSQLTAGSVTTAILAAGSVETSNLAAGAVTAATIAAGTITGSNIAATTISSSNLDVATLSAISANVGTLTGGTISNNSGTNVLNLSATGSSAFISTPQLTITAAGDATFSGALSAATGSFAGSLSAATGTFAGSLSAATGTFSGSLSAANGTFTGTLSGASGTFSGSLTAQVITASNIQSGAVSSAANYSAYNSGGEGGLEVASGDSATLWSQSFTGAYTTMIVARVNFYAGTSSMDCQANLLVDGTVYDTAYFKVYGSGSTPYNTSVSLNCYYSDVNGGSHTVTVDVYNNNGGGLNFWYSMPNATILRLLS